MNKRGIVMIAMGEEYERLAADTLRYSLQFISIPVTVIFNRENYLGDWTGLDQVNKIFIACDTDRNREIKTQLYEYSPYAETLYMDVDSVIHKEGIERVFEGLKENHIVFQLHYRWEKFKKYYDIYRRAMNKFDCSLPIDIMIGGFFAFRRSADTERFFDLWLEYWEDFGHGRDMPPLACAIQNSGISYSTITRQEDKLFSFGMDYECTAVHRLKNDDLKFFGIKPHKQNKPFDIGHRSDWTMVYFNHHQNVWLEKKVNTALQDKRERKYIRNYFPCLRDGGKKVLDIGCGFGQFMLVCRRYGNDALGIVPPLEKYERRVGLSNSDSLDYELYCRDRMNRHHLSFVECDFQEAILNNNFPKLENKFDVVNCKHAINLILRNHFNFKTDISNYDNKGSWIIDGGFRKSLETLFDFISEILTPEGVFFIASLNSVNAIEYSGFIQDVSRSKGFECEIFNNERNHRFKKCTTVK